MWQINKIPKYLKFHGWLVYLIFGWEMRRLSKSLEIRFWMASFLKMSLLYFTLLDAREFWKVSSDSCLTWWLSGAASRLLSLSNCCSCGFFPIFMKLSVVYAASLCTFVRFETMTWPEYQVLYKNSNFKSLLNILSTQMLERKRSEEYLVIILVVKRKLWAICLPWVDLARFLYMS